MFNISVIIPTFNRKEYLKKLLIQLINQKLNNNIILNIIVINDGSSDGTSKMLREEFSQVITILGNGNWWWTKCINEGIKLSMNLNTDFVLLLNDDNEIKDNYINSLISDYQTLIPGSILGSASVSLENYGFIDSSGTKYFSKLFCKKILFHPRNSTIDKNFFGIHECYYFSGRGTLIPNDMISKLGLFDEKMVQYGSDEDYILTAKEKGVPIFITWNSLIYNHTRMTSIGKFPQKLTFFSYLATFFNKYTNTSLSLNYLFYKKHCYAYFAPMYIIYFFVISLIIFFIRKIKLNNLSDNLFDKIFSSYLKRAKK